MPCRDLRLEFVFSMRPIARIAAMMLALVAAAPAWAQGPPRGPMQPLIVCLADYQRLCPGVPPGGGRIMACLNAQAEKLSQACFQALAERGLALTAALRLCRTDYDRLCLGVPVGRGQALACLLDNRARLSAGCRNALAAHGFGADGE
jgi:hypothetical protein